MTRQINLAFLCPEFLICDTGEEEMPLSVTCFFFTFSWSHDVSFLCAPHVAKPPCAPHPDTLCAQAPADSPSSLSQLCSNTVCLGKPTPRPAENRACSVCLPCTWHRLGDVSACFPSAPAPPPTPGIVPGTLKAAELLNE